VRIERIPTWQPRMVMSRHPLWLSGTGRFRSDSMSASHSRSSRTGFVTSYRWCASLRRDACKWMYPHSAGRGAGRAQTHSHADERACISLARTRWRGGLGQIAEILGSCQSPCDRACARRWRPGALNAPCLMAQTGASGGHRAELYRGSLRWYGLVAWCG
jgi:hypothetical protein